MLYLIQMTERSVYLIIKTYLIEEGHYYVRKIINIPRGELQKAS